MTLRQMIPPGHKYTVDGWIEERTLGSGGFGTVTLWKNEESGELLALKKCTIHGDMSSKLKQRWKLECDIMLRLEHENVIKAYPVPKALDIARQSDLPLLAMEYCEGGDLRKVLNKPENCNGVPELQVRNIVSHVAAAIEYLHSKRIIHRDLKPENIVISTVDQKLVYKLIDLGYAKDLDQGSVCTSFVGTMQYLAPELFMSQKYTCTVDYWSFGTLAFECCVGIRPFFHSIPPIKWQNEVSRKHKDDIHGFMLEGKPCFSKSLPYPNYICRTTRFYIEQFLRFMLLWDPKERGGGIMETNRPRCFALLENILKTKLIQVLIVPKNELLTYPISDPKLLIKDVMGILEKETHISAEHQELLLASGTLLEPEQPAMICLPDIPEDEAEEEWIVFLLDKRDISFPPKSRMVRNMPVKVNDMVTEPRTLTMYQEQKVSWGHSFFFCRQVRKDYDRLISAQRALMLCLLRYHSNFSKLQADLKTDIGSLQSKMEFFQRCQDYDLSKYNEQSKTGISSDKMFYNWNEIGNQVTKFASLQTEVARLESNCTKINQTVMELNRSPYSRSKQESSLKDMEENALGLYTKLRHTPVELRNRSSGDNMPMVSLILKLLNQRTRLTEDLYLHMGKVVQCKAELLITLPKIQNTIKTINDAGTRLVAYQLQRQKDMWQLVSVALRQNKMLQQKQTKQKTRQDGQQTTQDHQPRSGQPLSHQNSDQSLQATMHNLGLDESMRIQQGQMVGRSVSRSSQDSASNVSQSSLYLDKYTEKSMHVLSENHNTRNRLETMLLSFHEDNIQKPQSASLNWDFLGLEQDGSLEQTTRKNYTAPISRSSFDTSQNSQSVRSSQSRTTNLTSPLTSGSTASRQYSPNNTFGGEMYEFPR